jgi:hypothetical protein
MGGVNIGYGQDVTLGISAELIKEWCLNSADPAVFAGGNRSFKVTVGKLYIDNTYLSAVLAGTPVDFVICPAGSTVSGGPKITVEDVVFTSWDFKAAQAGVISEGVTGEGTGFTAGVTS